LPLGRMEDNGHKGAPYGERSSSGEVILVANVAGTAFCTCSVRASFAKTEH
jgi:hypothetical protein